MVVAKLKCKFCKDYEYRENITKTPFGKFCSKEHAYHFAQDKLEKDKNKAIAKSKREHAKKEKDIKVKYTKIKRNFKENDTKYQHKLTQPVFNRLRVLQELKWFSDRGLEPTCISCGKEIGNDQWSNGHFKTIGAQGNLRYHKNNCFLQHNRRCNMMLSGDISGTKSTHGYKQGLVDRFGKEKANEIINYCETNTQVKKWTGEELKKLRNGFNKQIKLMT